MNYTHSLFQNVEIETCNTCTRKCPWCNFGQSEDYQNRETAFLDSCYIEQIIRDLNKMNFGGVLSLFSINEPLLDERICSGELISLSKNILNHDAKVNIVTNGDLLTEEIAKNMIGAGLDILCISCYDENALNKAKAFNSIFKDNVNFRIFDYRPDNRHLLKYNRAGSIQGKTTEILPFCMRPIFSSTIGWDGQVRLCCHDSLGKIKFGNIKTESYYDIIQSKKMKSIRRKLAVDRSNIYPCNTCNYEGFSPDIQNEYYETEKTNKSG